jgi:hypothetical protein
MALSARVRCCRCRKIVRRELAVEVGGRFYGADCAAEASETAVFWCESCERSYPEEDMATVTMCRGCEAAS